MILRIFADTRVNEKNIKSPLIPDSVHILWAGEGLKNLIYFKCKQVAYYTSILNKQGLKTSKRIQKFNSKFKGKQNNFFNNVVDFILQQCLEQNIGTIILGYNKNFQYKSNMGRKQNQIFTSLAFKKFKEKLETQCKKHDITLILQEESYTSKSSFIDNDILPVYNRATSNSLLLL